MVLIVDGEILADTDPRAIAARQRRGVASSSGGAARPAPPQQPQRSAAPPAGGGAARNPLDQLAEAIGIQGQSVTIPAIWRVPMRQVPLIWLLLLGGLTMFAGWRVPAAAALLHVFSGLSEAGTAPGSQPTPAGSGPAPRPGGPAGR